MYYDKKQIPLAITFSALVLLFEPFIKVDLDRVMWNVVDLLVALLLIILLLKDKDGTKTEGTI